jgi:DNA polymerase III delta prime subunit
VVQLETIFYPQLESSIRQLSIDAMVLAASDDKELRFLDILSELQSELTMLQQMDLTVFLPKLKLVSDCSQIQEEENNQLKNSFERVSAKRRKVINQTLELKSLCNNFMSKSRWTESKLKSCKSLFQFYSYLIEYNNFQELTLSPLIYSQLGNSIFIN